MAAPWDEVVRRLWAELPPRATSNDGPRLTIGLLAPGQPADPTGASWDVVNAGQELAQVLSPGLASDAAVYADVLRCLPAAQCRRLAAEPAPGGPAEVATARAIADCAAVVAFELLGTAAVVRALRAARAAARLRALVLVPNLEVLDPAGARWAPTLGALDLVTVVVAKTASLVPVLEAWVAATWPRSASRLPTVALVGHCCPLPVPVPAAAARDTVLHFAGCSGSKNTLACVRAGVALVRRGLPGARRCVVCITPKWVPPPEADDNEADLGRRALAGTIYGVPPAALDEIRRLVAANHDVAELVLPAAPLSEAAKAALYARGRLALCCSNAEGFGHTILEAAAYGCLVVTTDGVPMRDVLLTPPARRAAGVRPVALAAPRARRPAGHGWWYEVDAEAIVAAAVPLLERAAEATDDEVVAACVASFAWRQRCLVRGLGALLDGLLPPHE